VLRYKWTLNGRHGPLNGPGSGRAPQLFSLRIRDEEAQLTRHGWTRVHRGADGAGQWLDLYRQLALMHSVAWEEDGELWEHISVSRADRVMPTWEQTRDVFREIAGPDALGIIVIPPKAEHVNLAEVAHVWRCLTARPLPDFTGGSGSI
jgi:hypothetical protein